MERKGVPPKDFWQKSNCNPRMTFALYFHVGPKSLELVVLARHLLLNNSQLICNRETNNMSPVPPKCALSFDHINSSNIKCLWELYVAAAIHLSQDHQVPSMQNVDGRNSDVSSYACKLVAMEGTLLLI